VLAIDVFATATRSSAFIRLHRRVPVRVISKPIVVIFGVIWMCCAAAVIVAGVRSFPP
jgi:hypothetical protein